MKKHVAMFDYAINAEHFHSAKSAFAISAIEQRIGVCGLECTQQRFVRSDFQLQFQTWNRGSELGI